MNTLLDLNKRETGLGVLPSTLPVVELARHVWIDERAVERLCRRWIDEKVEALGASICHAERIGEISGLMGLGPASGRECSGK